MSYCLIGVLLYILNVIKHLSALIKIWQIHLQSLHYITLMIDDTSESEDLMNVCMCNIVWKSIHIITITLLITFTNWRLFREQQNDQSYSAITSGYFCTVFLWSVWLFWNFSRLAQSSGASPSLRSLLHFMAKNLDCISYQHPFDDPWLSAMATVMSTSLILFWWYYTFLKQ